MMDHGFSSTTLLTPKEQSVRERELRPKKTGGVKVANQDDCTPIRRVVLLHTTSRCLSIPRGNVKTPFCCHSLIYLLVYSTVESYFSSTTRLAVAMPLLSGSRHLLFGVGGAFANPPTRNLLNRHIYSASRSSWCESYR